MTTPCECACAEARAKVEVVVISLRVMRAGLEALEKQIDQMLATAETELNQVSERVCPENAVLPAPVGESAPQGSTEADRESHDIGASKGLVDPAVAETADCPPDVGAQRANETTIFEQTAALLADSGAYSPIPVTADTPNEEYAGEDPLPTGADECKDDPSTPCNDKTMTDSPLEPAGGNTADHKFEPQSSEGPASPAANDDVQFTICGSNIVTFARRGRRMFTRGRRMFRNFAAPISASLVLVGSVSATKFGTLLTSLSRATDLR